MTHITPPAMSIPQRMQQIAARLGQLYRLKAGAEIEQEEQQAEYDARMLSVTPDAGWPGKNEQERKTAAGKAEGADEILGRMRANMREHRAHIADYSASIAALEAERRGLEWTVRADMAKAIGGRQGAADNGQSEDHGAPDAQLETVAWDETVFALADGEIYGDTPTADERQQAALNAIFPELYTSELEF